MGEAAEMLLDGTCCEGCGEFLDGESPGHTRLCTSCSRDTRLSFNDARTTKVQCTKCKKWVSKLGLAQHIRMKHG